VSRSLQRQLSLTLGIAIVLTGFVAAIASFGLAYIDAQDFQDDTLREVAALAGSGADSRALVPNRGENETDSSVILMRLPDGKRPSWLPADLRPGFHTLAQGSDRMRVYVRELGNGERVAVAQATELRDESALSSALRTLIPLLLLFPLLAFLTFRLVGRELAPIRRLAENLDRQSPDRPQPLPDERVPDEMASFVHAINRLLGRIQRLINQQRRFVADAAHELRTPLTALSVQAQNLEQAGSLQAMQERIMPLRTGIERARRLTEQLLSLARMQAGVDEAAPVRVSDMARELIADCLPLAEERGIDLGLDETADLQLLVAPETLRLILKNGLDNALAYTPAGGKVTLRLSTDGDDATIEVIDTGPGIRTGERERVFEAFYRMEGSAGNGSGLGLAIARDAAERLGGSVSLHDRRDGPGLVLRYRQRL
jgi:two-component system OmpR family sensor kinase